MNSNISHRLRLIATITLFASAVLDIMVRIWLATAQQARLEPAPVMTSAMVALVLAFALNKISKDEASRASARVPIAVRQSAENAGIDSRKLAGQSEWSASSSKTARSANGQAVWRSGQHWLLLQLIMIGRLSSLL